MKSLILVLIAVATVTVSVFLTVRFISHTRRIIALQANPAIRLPVAPRPNTSNVSSDAIIITLTADGAAQAGGADLSDDSLHQLIAANSDKRLVVQAAPGVKYEQIKAFLRKLQGNGVNQAVLKTDNP